MCVQQPLHRMEHGILVAVVRLRAQATTWATMIDVRVRSRRLGPVAVEPAREGDLVRELRAGKDLSERESLGGICAVRPL